MNACGTKDGSESRGTIRRLTPSSWANGAPLTSSRLELSISIFASSSSGAHPPSEHGANQIQKNPAAANSRIPAATATRTRLARDMAAVDAAARRLQLELAASATPAGCGGGVSGPLEAPS